MELRIPSQVKAPYEHPPVKQQQLLLASQMVLSGQKIHLCTRVFHTVLDRFGQHRFDMMNLLRLVYLIGGFTGMCT